MFDLTTMTLLTQLLLLASLSSLGYGFLFGCKCGKVEPPDPYVFFNDTIVMNCTLNSVTETLNSSDLYFIENNFNNIGKKIPSEIVDEKTIMLTKIARPGDEGNYFCNSSFDIVGGQKLRLEYKPPKLENEDMTCILYNWGEKMECSWELPFLSMFYINVTLEWSNNPRFSARCPELTMGKTTVCRWPSSSAYSLGANAIWQFHILITNTRQNFTVESILKKEILKFVKPNKVRDFSISLTNDSHCVMLSWEYDSHRLQSARIRYISKRSSVVNTQHTRNKTEVVIICSLFPNADYNFTIDVKAAEGVYWSDPVVKAFTTDEDVPMAAPEMRPGCYEYSSDECKTENIRHLTKIFWKRIPKDERNGVITGYNIIIRNLDINFVNNTHINGEQDISKSLMLNCSNKYNVTIKARTKKGVSPYGSSILIPKGYNTDLIPPKVTVEVEDKDQELLNVFNVTWTLPAKVARNTIRGFTVHYCRGGSSGTCQEELQSVNVSAEKRWLLLRNLDGFHLIGVSMESAKFSSGLSFTSCVYKKNQVPPVPSNVEVHTQMDNTLTVTWGPTNCNGDNPYVIKYTVYWCKLKDQDCDEPMKIHEVLSSESLSYDLTNLEKGQRYGVQVTAHSYYQTSQRSEMIIQVPKNSDLNIGQLTGISFAVIFVLVLCLAGLVFCIRVCREKYQTLNKELQIEVPHVESRNPYRQNSDESGIGSMNEDNHRRSFASPLIFPQPSNYMPVVNNHYNATDEQNGYQCLYNASEQSHDHPKDSAEETKNSLICLPSSSYSKTDSPDNVSNNENSVTSARLNEQPSTDATSKYSATPRIFQPLGEDQFVTHAGYFRPKIFHNAKNGAVKSCIDTRLDLKSSTGSTVSGYVKELKPPNMSKSTSSDYVKKIKAMMLPDTATDALSDYAKETRAGELPALSHDMHLGNVKDINAIVTPTTSSGTSSEYTRTKTGKPPTLSIGMNSDYVKYIKDMVPTDPPNGSHVDYRKEITAGEQNGIHAGYVKDKKATVQPRTSNHTHADCIKEIAARELSIISNGMPSDYVKDIKAMMPSDASSDTPLDYVRETKAGEPVITSMLNDTSSDNVNNIKGILPSDASNGTPSDYVRETTAGEPNGPTMSNDISSDYVTDIKAMVPRVVPDNGQDTDNIVDGSFNIQ